MGTWREGGRIRMDGGDALSAIKMEWMPVRSRSCQNSTVADGRGPALVVVAGRAAMAPTSAAVTARMRIVSCDGEEV